MPGAGRQRRWRRRGRPPGGVLPLPGRPPLTRLAVWVSALETHHRHHTRTHRARLHAGQDHRGWVGGVEAVMRIAVGSDHAGFHLKEHVKAGAGGTGPRRRRRRHGVVARRRLPALRRGGRAAWSARATSRAPCWPAGRASAWRSSPTRSPACARSTRTTLGGRDGAPPQRRQHRDALGRAPRARARPTPSSAPSCAPEFEGGRHARRVGPDRRAGARAGGDVVVAPSQPVRRPPCYRRQRRDWRVGGTDHREATHLICRSAWAHSASRRGGAHVRAEPRLLQPPAGRGRSRGRRRHRSTSSSASSARSR